jgi:hypothetical protein
MARDVTVTLEIRGVPDSKLDQDVIEALEERLVARSADQEAPWSDWEAKVVRGIIRLSSDGTPRRLRWIWSLFV